MGIERNNVLLEFNLPEFKRDEIEVSFRNSSAYIKALKSFEIKEESADLFHDEKSSSSFLYREKLPKNVDVKKAKIDFVNNVLVIKIPLKLKNTRKEVKKNGNSRRN
jgi:HSP20 family molecular chaperone IbpA